MDPERSGRTKNTSALVAARAGCAFALEETAWVRESIAEQASEGLGGMFGDAHISLVAWQYSLMSGQRPHCSDRRGIESICSHVWVHAKIRVDRCVRATKVRCNASSR